MEITAATRAAAGPRGATERDPRLWQAAKEFEAVFLAQMLQAAGLGEGRSAFGGGAGEEAFSGLLAARQARIFVERGGIGLARRLYAELAGPAS
ncbi:MAG: flagellar biosynthesis protein FlgJ [Paracoccaceae bacterium]